MNVDAFLDELRRSKGYREQIVYTHDVPPRPAQWAQPQPALSPPVRRMLDGRGIERLYVHQAEAVEALAADRDPLVATSTASGKSLCYQIPIIEMLLRDPAARALLLFPTKALAQDQFQSMRRALDDAGLDDVLAGVHDGDTPSELRRRLRDGARILVTNPDMLHAAIMPQHPRWAAFFSRLRIIVVDELHVYSGIFGANAANLFRRLHRVLQHYDANPRIIAASATVANPLHLGRAVLRRDMRLIDRDGSPRGRRVWVLWNPPRIRSGNYRSRRSANVEAHEIMAALIERGAPTIVFSKAKMTAEMIHRYVRERLAKTAPHLAARITPYRGGYRPEERREIERRLFSGELIGVSSTPALELGIDVGALEAAVLVGYPGTLASFFQQAGRAGRQDRDALVVLIGVDTAVNQYIMTHPEYLFGRPLEEAVIEADNPFVLLGHLRCATHELPLPETETGRFGPHAANVLRILQENRKVRLLRGAWYHAATETPQHEVGLRDKDDANVTIEDVDTGEVIGEVDRFDAPPILHPNAIYMHLGDTYRVLSLDVEDKNIARVQRVDVDYYTQPLGGTDVHHIDHRLRETKLGETDVYWGEVTAYFKTWMFEKIHFYTLDAVSRHGLDLPTFQLETMAVWIVPPDSLLDAIRRAGHDVHAGLRAIGYAMRMLLPLFMTCDTLDFSHSVGSVNSPWQAVFVYERYPLGLGFTEKAFHRIGEILRTARRAIRLCPCDEGCPCCVGKPLRQFTTWNIERGEASIPSKPAALAILDGILGPDDAIALAHPECLRETAPEMESPPPGPEESTRLEQALRRRLERMREPMMFHPIEPRIETEYPQREPEPTLPAPDVATRARRRTDISREIRQRMARKEPTDKIAPLKGRPDPPAGMRTRLGNLPPVAFPGNPERSGRGTGEPHALAPGQRPEKATPPAGKQPALPETPREPGEAPAPPAVEPIRLGDDLAAKVRAARRRSRNTKGEN